MQKHPNSPSFNQIKKLNGHNKSMAIEDFAKGNNTNDEKISILILALNDPDYGFCTYETCVESAATHLYDLKEFLTHHIQREELLKILINDLTVGPSSTEDYLARVKLLGVFKSEAKSVLQELKNALDDFGDDSEYSSEDWYKDSSEYKHRSILINTIEQIENE